MSKCSTTCYVLMLLDDLSKQWMYEYAQAVRCKLGKCATTLECDVLLCSTMRSEFMRQTVHVDRPRCELRTCSYCKHVDSSARLVACWLERAEASRSAATLAFNRSSRSANLTSELASILFGKPGALSIEIGSSLSFLMLGG